MHGFWMLVREGGWGAMLALFLGFIGSIVGLGAGITLAFSRRAAFWVGLAALVIASLTSGAGLLGMSSEQRMVDGAIGAVSSNVQKERIRQEGYKEARGAAKIGFGASALPLALGVLAIALGAGAKPKAVVQSHYPQNAFAPPPPKPPSATGRWLAGGGVALFALLTCGGALAASMSALPTGRYAFSPEDADAWSLAEARDTFDSDQLAGCDELDAALESLWLPTSKASAKTQWPRQFARDPDALVPDWRATATQCVRILWPEVKAKSTTTRHASIASSRTPKTWTRDALLESPLLVDEALHVEILAFTAPESALGASGARNQASLHGGATTVDGRLPPEVIQRIVRQSFGRLRMCYETALGTNPTLEGTVRVKFVIGRDGSVTSSSDAGSDLPDATTKSCVVHVFSGLSFPAPEGGVVTVTYPITFTPSRAR